MTHCGGRKFGSQSGPPKIRVLFYVMNNNNTTIRQYLIDDMDSLFSPRPSIYQDTRFVLRLNVRAEAGKDAVVTFVQDKLGPTCCSIKLPVP